MSQNDSPSTSLSLSAIAELSTVLAGLVYVTGFLVVYNYLDMLGVHDVPADFFKLKYIHVGILCLVPIVLGLGLALAFVMLYGVWQARRKKNRHHIAQHGKPRRKTLRSVTPSYTGLLLIGNLLVVFYVLVMFTTFGSIRERYPYFITLCIVTLGGLFVGSDVLPQLTYYLPMGVLSALVRAYGVALRLEKRQIPMSVRMGVVFVECKTGCAWVQDPTDRLCVLAGHTLF